MPLSLIALVGGSVYAGYVSLAYPAARKAMEEPRPVIYEGCQHFGFENRFNPSKLVTETHIGQFGLPECYIPDGMGCLTRIGCNGLGEIQW